jgi:hypothetical protein
MNAQARKRRQLAVVSLLRASTLDSSVFRERDGVGLTLLPNIQDDFFEKIYVFRFWLQLFDQLQKLIL